MFILIILNAAFGAAGCGPDHLLQRPEELPESLAGRRLWHTPQGYIYAADEAVAGETDRWIKDVEGHVRRNFKTDLGKGLVIVVDKAETPVIASFDELVRLQNSAARAAGASDKDLPTLQTQRKKLDESGMSESLACAVTPVPLDDAALAAAGLSGPLPADVTWRMCCPSERLMESATWEFAPHALAKKKGKAFAAMTAWAWPLAFPEAAKAFRLARDSLAFSLWASSRHEWAKEQRADEIERYTKQRAFLISPTLSLALTIAKNQKKQEASEPPAPAQNEHSKP